MSEKDRLLEELSRNSGDLSPRIPNFAQRRIWTDEERESIREEIKAAMEREGL